VPLFDSGETVPMSDAPYAISRSRSSHDGATIVSLFSNTTSRAAHARKPALALAG
jgi:hypothetical protein